MTTLQSALTAKTKRAIERLELYGRLDESARARRLEPFERRRGLQRLPERPGDFGPIDKTDTRGLTDGLAKAAQEIADSSLTTNRAVQDFIRGLAGVAAELAGARMKLQACGPRRR